MRILLVRIKDVQRSIDLPQIKQFHSFIRRTSSNNPFIKGIESQAVNLTRYPRGKKKSFYQWDIE